MSSDDPDKTLFRQPKPGGDRTIFMPKPGGKGLSGQTTPSSSPSGWATPEPKPQRANPLPYEPPQQIEASGMTMAVGVNPLVGLATTLLAVFEKTQHTVDHPDVGGLHRRLVSEIKQFQDRANERGIAKETVKYAGYLLCSVLDEAVLKTPWGSAGPWSRNMLQSKFYGDREGGKKSFAIIDHMRQRPAENLDFLELSYLCLSLGFEGKYRLMSRGRDQLEKLRDELFRAIRNHRGEYERDLSPAWHGLGKTRNTLSESIPTWVVVCCVVAILFFSYSGFRYWLYQMSNPIVEELTEIAAIDDHKPEQILGDGVR